MIFLLLQRLSPYLHVYVHVRIYHCSTTGYMQNHCTHDLQCTCTCMNFIKRCLGTRLHMIACTHGAHPGSVHEYVNGVWGNGCCFLKTRLTLAYILSSSKYPSPLYQCIHVHLGTDISTFVCNRTQNLSDCFNNIVHYI